MSYHNEPPLLDMGDIQSACWGQPALTIPAVSPWAPAGRASTTGDDKPATWPDLAYWREVAEQRERDLDAARTMICELSRRPTVEEYNCLITELRRRGWPGPILTGAAPAPAPASDSRKDIVAPFPLRALRTWHRPLP
jgi:hypothetical protein